MATSKLQSDNRIQYLDYLRVFAIAAVVMIHVSANSWTDISFRSADWVVMNVYDSLSAWAVPVFLMISGALFLSREKVDVKRLYTKNIPRLAVAYIIWSVFYALTGLFSSGSFVFDIGKFVRGSIEGEFHLWYVPMIIGVYMCIPIIRQIVKSKEALKCFMILSFVFTFIIPQIKEIGTDFFGGYVSTVIDYLCTLIDGMHMDLVFGYAFYFMLGYLLFNYEISLKQRRIIYIAGAAGVFFATAMNILAAYKNNVPCSSYFDIFTLNTLAESMAVFLLCRYGIKNGGRIYGFISKLSKYSFGAYLVHIFIMRLLIKAGLHALAFNPVFAIPLTVLAVSVISFFISFIINQIPVLKKWIV